MVDSKPQPVMIPGSYDSVGASEVKPCPQVHGAAGLYSHRVQVVPVMKKSSAVRIEASSELEKAHTGQPLHG